MALPRLAERSKRRGMGRPLLLIENHGNDNKYFFLEFLFLTV